jgi:hypothetical protein
MVTKRVNVTIPGELHEMLREAAETHYGGNLSRYLTDAGLYYAGVLAGRKEQRPAPENESTASKQV